MRSFHSGAATAALLAGLLLSGTASAAVDLAAAGTGSAPMPAPLPAPVPAPRDQPYPGVLEVAVDATDLTHGIFSVRETVPLAAPGPVVLTYPRWLPGNHAPSGPIDKLAGLEITADGQPLEWTRDPVDVFAFHVTPPAGTKALQLRFQFLSPVSTREGRVVMTPEMLNAQWNALALYPAGWFTRDIPVKASIRLPDGWKYATALDTERDSGGTVQFRQTTFETFVDSPLIAGRYFRQVELDPGGPVPVRLDVIADRADELEMTPEQIAPHRELVQQAYRLFGSHHYDHYDFLLSLSDKMGGIGLEHHQSSEDGTTPKYFADWDKTSAGRDLLAHEFTHSWDGKFRRPADLWTPTFNVPMRGSLLWVYEGQTQYWGYVLAARSGLLTQQQALDAIAMTAAVYDARIGRRWRAMEDTTNDPIIAQRRPLSWLSWQRSEDYYSEGQLIWLDADTLIRQRSGGKRSLDDFARAFYGVNDGSHVPATYDFDTVVRTLNGVEPYDWAGFLNARLLGHGPGAPLDGVSRGGYRLVFTPSPTEYFRAAEARRKVTDLTYSLGLSVNRDGQIGEVIWDGPAFRAGLTADTMIVAVNGLTYTAEDLKDAVRMARGTGPAVELLVKINDHFRTVRIDYHEGLRYPRLERLVQGDAALDAILAPRRK